LDADGVAAAGVIGKMLYRLDARFRIGDDWVDEKLSVKYRRQATTYYSHRF
jgi:hypothetical protein